MAIGLPPGYKQPNFRHSVGISVVVPYAHNLTATPNMLPREVAYNKGRDAARRGRKADENPYPPEQAQLSAEFMRGYDDEGCTGPRLQPEGDALGEG